MIHSHVEFINRALGGLFQLLTELLGIDRGHLTAPVGEGEKPRIPGLADVGGLQELEIGMDVIKRPPFLVLAKLDGPPSELG